MLQIIKKLLLGIVDDIDAGNSNASEEEQVKIIKTLQKYTRKDNRWSKYQAYTFLGISRATFDRYVREGKIPRGKSSPGFKELYWSEREIRKLAKTQLNK
jgi:hypothetical protein